jgi:hypothetical protein
MRLFVLLGACLFIFGTSPQNHKLSEFLTPTTDTNLYGNVQVTTILQDNGHGRYYDAIITASFNVSGSTNYSTVNSVKYDGRQLKLRDDLNGAYSDTSGIQPITGKTWEVDGGSAIPSFIYTPINNAPSFSGFLNVPNSLNRNVDFDFLLDEISNATNVSIQISDGENIINQDIYSSNSAVNRGIQVNNFNGATVQFNENSLLNLTETENGFIQLIVSNVDVQAFNGKKVAFSNMFIYRKTNLIIN